MCEPRQIGPDGQYKLESLVFPKRLQKACQSGGLRITQPNGHGRQLALYFGCKDHLCGAVRDVAAVMNIPMALRHIKPGVAHLASSVICTPGLLHFMPDKV